MKIWNLHSVNGLNKFYSPVDFQNLKNKVLKQSEELFSKTKEAIKHSAKTRPVTAFDVITAPLFSTAACSNASSASRKQTEKILLASLLNNSKTSGVQLDENKPISATASYYDVGNTQLSRVLFSYSMTDGTNRTTGLVLDQNAQFISNAGKMSATFVTRNISGDQAADKDWSAIPETNSSAKDYSRVLSSDYDKILSSLKQDDKTSAVKTLLNSQVSIDGAFNYNYENAVNTDPANFVTVAATSRYSTDVRIVVSINGKFYALTVRNDGTQVTVDARDKLLLWNEWFTKKTITTTVDMAAFISKIEANNWEEARRLLVSDEALKEIISK